MTRVLVVQLCRLGDILQTTPMLRGLRRQHPGAEITLLVLDGFSSAPVPTRLYDHLVAFPFDRAAASLGVNGDGWRDALREIEPVVAQLSSVPFDLILNLTGSALANLLCAVIPSREVRGGLIAPDRSRVVRGPWMTYFWSSLLSRSMGCVNLVDLFQWVAGVGIDGLGLEIDVPESAERTMEAWLSARGLTGERLVALQLGASDERKRWPPERFAAMADLLPDDAGTIVFVGSAGERPLVARAQAVLKRSSVSAAGETSVPELAALLSRCRLLVTNDTGTMHVASAVGTRIVDLSTGPVFVHETGPYGVGHVAVEPASACFPCAAGSVCHHLSCREDFTPADIAAVARFALGEGDCPQLGRARVLRASRTATRRLEFMPIAEPSADVSGGLRPVFARMWEATLPVPRPAGLRGADDEDVILEVSTDGLRRLNALAESAASEIARLQKATAGRQAAAAAALDGLLGRATTLASFDPVVHPIVAFLRTEIESCASRDVKELVAVYRSAWRAAGQRASWLIDRSAEALPPQSELSTVAQR